MNAEASGYFSHARPEMLPMLPARYTRVLEIGCGAGEFARQLAAGTEVWGIEPSPEAAAVAQMHLHRVLTGTFDSAKAALPAHYFDLLVCNDVIEHMPDHDAFLREVRAALAPGAAIVVSVPNIRFIGVIQQLLFARDFRYEAEGIMDRTHLRCFTFRSLKRSVEEAGFQVETIRGIAPIDLLRISSKRLLLALFILLSLGRWSDMRFRQIALRARLAG